jgi:hypothetical protein
MVVRTCRESIRVSHIHNTWTCMHVRARRGGTRSPCFWDDAGHAQSERRHGHLTYNRCPPTGDSQGIHARHQASKGWSVASFRFQPRIGPLVGRVLGRERKGKWIEERLHSPYSPVPAGEETLAGCLTLPRPSLSPRHPSRAAVLSIAPCPGLRRKRCKNAGGTRSSGVAPRGVRPPHPSGAPSLAREPRKARAGRRPWVHARSAPPTTATSREERPSAAPTFSLRRAASPQVEHGSSSMPSTLRQPPELQPPPI